MKNTVPFKPRNTVATSPQKSSKDRTYIQFSVNLCPTLERQGQTTPQSKDYISGEVKPDYTVHNVSVRADHLGHFSNLSITVGVDNSLKGGSVRLLLISGRNLSSLHGFTPRRIPLWLVKCCIPQYFTCLPQSAAMTKASKKTCNHIVVHALVECPDF